MRERFRHLEGLGEAAARIRSVPPGRVRVLLSDVHGNLPALEAVLEQVDRLGVERGRIINLGDIFGYGPQPFEVIQEARTFGVNLLGNHDFLALASHRRELWTSLGLPEGGGPADPVLEVTASQGSILRDPSVLSFVEALPASHRLGETALLVHDSPRSHGTGDVPQDRLLTADAFCEAFECMARDGFRSAFHGHDHTPGLVRAPATDRPAPDDLEPGRLDDVAIARDERTILDVGAVGQPRDGDPRAAFCVLELDEAGEPAGLTLCRVPYPVEETARRVRRAGYPPFFARRLHLGI